MDNVAVSRRNHTNKKGNKENTQPAHGSKSLIKRDKTAVAPFHLKSNEKEETLAKNGPLKAKAKQADMRSTSGEALKKAKSGQKDGKRAAPSDVTQRQTYSQAFVTEQAVRHKKIVAEATKPPATVQSSRSAPGMYKGKIVQSKIGSIWKSSVSVDRADPKPSALKTERQRVGNTTKTRSKSVADLPGHGTQKPAPTRSKSAVDRPAQVSKPTVTSRPPAGFTSARPPARTVPATLSSTSCRNTTVAPSKGSGIQVSKPKISATDKKVNKPPVSSTLSQYRFTMETAEERRAKLAEWLASKGKTFKRPAMTTAAPPKTNTSKPGTGPKSQSHVEPQPAAQCKPQPEPSLEVHQPHSPAANCANTQGAELTTYNKTPVIMNTSLELLENSDVDLLDPQDSVDDIVVNLCDALEAMATPSRCSDEISQASDECNDVDNKPKDECKKEEVKGETPQDVSEQLKVEPVKNEAEESGEHKVETDDEEEVESDEDDDDCVMETTPQMEDASVVKYSVKTTPYLQSVKKTIEGEVSVSTSRRKSNIKDLKFLTPVRRSCRIQRKSSHLPAMLVDHDTCVSSLAELVKLDDDPNAYIYRKNPALLEDLPDQPRL
ncbi:cytoskeleton-associated protein 2 [Lates calcarifer]|uniref:Cytoskeleton-associated protein 2 n=1 Tax=Lates calcarifer TaxID=8187 RepID=A0AAJ7Q5B7_LATCA|nr:cytoskeleton-associated protein 2 [Lates calcarifer]